jgi:hypothetical protein
VERVQEEQTKVDNEFSEQQSIVTHVDDKAQINKHIRDNQRGSTGEITS